MAIGPKGPPEKPGLSIRGRVIFDTWRGKPRVRPWPVSKPTKPGSPREWHAKAFGAANRACKITASKIYGAHWEATRGTPLLPRDLMIAFMYGRAFALTLEDGRIIRSVAARNDVSKSLDLISNTPGDYLVRGEKYWETLRTPPGNPRAMMSFTQDWGGQDHSTMKPINWDRVAYDNGGYTNLAAHPQAFVIPAGINAVQLTLALVITAIPDPASVIALTQKNGTFNFDGSVTVWHTAAGSTTGLAHISSGPIPVAEGDSLRIQLETPGGTNWSYMAPRCSFSIIKVG